MSERSRKRHGERKQLVGADWYAIHSRELGANGSLSHRTPAPISILRGHGASEALIDLVLTCAPKAWRAPKTHELPTPAWVGGDRPRVVSRMHDNDGTRVTIGKPGIEILSGSRMPGANRRRVVREPLKIQKQTIQEQLYLQRKNPRHANRAVATRKLRYNQKECGRSRL